MGLLADLISKVGLDTREFEKNLDRSERKLIRSGRRMSLMGNDLTQNISLPLIAVGAGAIKAAADIERLELALKNTMGAGYSEELEKLVQVAKDPGLGFEQAVRGSVALQAVGQSADDARKMLREWGNAVAAAGGTAHNLDRVIVQLQQALSKQGNLLREDWKFIVQQAPQAQKAMMDLYGTGSTEELAKMGVTAQQAIRDITNELSKLGRVEGGIANAFVNFTDEMKQALVPLGKAIFESASLRETMAGLVSTVTLAAKAFTGLSSETQKWIIRGGAFLITIGPFVRTMGSLKLVLAAILPNLKRGANLVTIFARHVDSAYTQTGMFSRSLLDLNKRFAEMPRYLTLAAGAIGLAGVAAGGAYVTGFFTGIIAKAAGRFAANNPNSVWAKIFNPAFFNTLAGDGAGQWVEGFTSEIAKNKQNIQKGIQNALKDINLTGIFSDSVSTQGNEIWSKSEMERQAKEAAESMVSELSKAFIDLKSELRSIDELGKLFPARDTINETREAIISYIQSLISEHGKVASSPEVQSALNMLKETRDVIQGIVKEIPKLSLLPTALSPTGGVPDLGASNLGRIQGVQKFDSSITKYYKGMRKANSLVNGVKEGLYSVDEAFMALSRDIGIEPARQVWRNFEGELRKSMIPVGEMMGELKSTLAGGFAEAIGGIISGENPMKSFIEGLLIPLADIIKRFGQMVIAAGALTEATKKMWLNPAAAIALGSAAIIAGTAAKNFFQKRLTSLAEGGIATGPTPALVGDNPRSPELITPLHKLPDLMRSVMGNMGGGVIRIQGELGIQGDKLTYFIDEQLDLRKSLSMY